MSDGSDSDYSESESDVEPKETVCKLCKREFANKYIKRRHQKRCGKGPSPLNKCMWCGMQFANRGNLATHAFHIHGDSSYKLLDGDKDRIYQCSVCNKGYKMKMFLTFHIRKNHFNLQAKIPCAERKKVNQVWFEKVLNSNKVVEIKKASASSLIMRSLNENTGIKVKDIDPKVVDLRNIYPTRTAQSSVECYVCHKKYQKKNFKKHFDEVHLNKRRNHCNLCNHTFKRAYQYLKHRCHKVKVKGIRSERGSAFRIASVESLSMP